MPEPLSLDQRIAICKEVPKEDWDKFPELNYVAVNIASRRIVDGDDDLQTLQDRIAANAAPDDQFFIAPGKTAQKGPSSHLRQL